jgi:hypothetical protein
MIISKKKLERMFEEEVRKRVNAAEQIRLEHEQNRKRQCELIRLTEQIKALAEEVEKLKDKVSATP